MKRAYQKPTANVYDINVNGFIASGGTCFRQKYVDQYSLVRFKTDSQTFTTYPSYSDQCWKWFNNQSF